MKTFDQWWEETYRGRLGNGLIETSYKELAKEAWEYRTEAIAQYVEDKYDFVGGEIMVAEHIRQNGSKED